MTTPDLTIEQLQERLAGLEFVGSMCRQDQVEVLERLLATMGRETELRNVLDDISRMDTEFQTLEMAMDIAKDALRSE